MSKLGLIEKSDKMAKEALMYILGRIYLADKISHKRIFDDVEKENIGPYKIILQQLIESGYVTMDKIKEIKYYTFSGDKNRLIEIEDYILGGRLEDLKPILKVFWIGVGGTGQEILRRAILRLKELWHLFDLSIDYKDHLNKGSINDELSKAFEEKKYPLSEDAKIIIDDKRGWVIVDSKRKYVILDTNKRLEVFIKNNEILAKFANAALSKRYLAVNSGPEIKELEGTEFFSMKELLHLYDYDEKNKKIRPELSGGGGNIGKPKQLFRHYRKELLNKIKDKTGTDEIDVFIITNSVGGGTGGSITPLIIKTVRKEFPGAYIFNFQMFPPYSEPRVLNVIYSLAETLKILFENKKDRVIRDKLKIFTLSVEHFIRYLPHGEDFTKDVRRISPYLDWITVETIINVLYQGLISSYKTDEPIYSDEQLSLEDIGKFVTSYVTLLFIEKIVPPKEGKIPFSELLNKSFEKITLTKDRKLNREIFAGGTSATLKEKAGAGSVLAVLSGINVENLDGKHSRDLKEACSNVWGETKIRTNFYWTSTGEMKVLLCIGGAQFADLDYWISLYDTDEQAIEEELGDEIFKFYGVKEMRAFKVARNRIKIHKTKILLP